MSRCAERPSPLDEHFAEGLLRDVGDPRAVLRVADREQQVRALVRGTLETTARRVGRALRAHGLDPKTVTVARSGRDDVVRVDLSGDDAAALIALLR